MTFTLQEVVAGLRRTLRPRCSPKKLEETVCRAVADIHFEKRAGELRRFAKQVESAKILAAMIEDDTAPRG